MSYNERSLQELLKKEIKKAECIVLTGPRQSGKTTLIREICRSLFGDSFTEISFDTPSEMDKFLRDPDLFFINHPGVLFLDEIQNVPLLFPYIKREVDKKRNKFRFFLSGSRQFSLMKNVSESLAGRARILELYPFAEMEKKERNKYPVIPFFYDEKIQKDYIGRKFTINDKELLPLLLRGGYPSVALKKKFDSLWYESYRKTYIQRDIRELSQISDLGKFDRFIILCASRTGNILNKSDLANSLDVDNKTIDHWLSLLETSYIIHQSKSYFTNISKRIVKSPKLHFIDIGLCLHLLYIQDIKALANSPFLGNFFESYVIMEIKKLFASRGLQIPLYYFRTSTGEECDLVLEQGGVPIPIEIKHKSKLNAKDWKSVLNFLGTHKNSKFGFLISMYPEITYLEKNIINIPLGFLLGKQEE